MGVVDRCSAGLAHAVRAVVESGKGALHLVEQAVDGVDGRFGRLNAVGVGQRVVTHLVGVMFMHSTLSGLGLHDCERTRGASVPRRVATWSRPLAMMLGDPTVPLSPWPT
jgi:hypothetical protein